MLQVIRSPKIDDVRIIGSEASGGAAAKVLTECGVSVVMLEAGRRSTRLTKDFKEHISRSRTSPNSPLKPLRISAAPIDPCRCSHAEHLYLCSSTATIRASVVASKPTPTSIFRPPVGHRDFHRNQVRPRAVVPQHVAGSVSS
jgi:choline dehydrogenase-like flavoprotein